MSEKPMHYAVIVLKHMHHDGDERSRTHPGHGYPEHTTTHSEIIEFANREKFMEWITENEKRTHGKKQYRAIAFKNVNVQTSLHIDIDIDE